MNSALDAKVKAVNLANQRGIELYKKLVEIFRPLIGKQVLKANDTLMKKYTDLLPKWPYLALETNVTIYRYSSAYSLVWVVKACISDNPTGPGIAHYAEASVYIGSIRDGVLVEISSPFEARTDYNAADVEAAREKYRIAKKASDDAFSALHPFGEYDR